MYNVHWTLHAYYGAAVIYQILFCIYAPLSKRLGKTSKNKIKKICAHEIVFFNAKKGSETRNMYFGRIRPFEFYWYTIFT